MTFSRRNFIRTGALTVASAGSLANVILATSPAAARGRRPFRGYGELVADPNQLLDLPRGFQYRVLSQEGDVMGSGVVPGSHDGMASFDARLRRHVARPKPRDRPRRRRRRRRAARASGARCDLRSGRHRRHDDPARRAESPLDRPSRESRRHGHELRRRPDAVGHLAHVRRGRQRPFEASRLRLRGRSRSRRQPGADPSDGPLRARSRRVRSARSRRT